MPKCAFKIHNSCLVYSGGRRAEEAPAQMGICHMAMGGINNELVNSLSRRMEDETRDSGIRARPKLICMAYEICLISLKLKLPWQQK